MTTRNNCLRLISWNTNGLNGAVKSGKVFSHLRYLQADVIFLQETHIKSSELNHIKKSWMGHLFHSKYSVRARGAAIIIRKGIHFEPTEVKADPNGRYVAVSGTLQGLPVTLACLYAPTWDDPDFFDKFFMALPNLNSHYIIIGGDFNLVQNVPLDRSSSKQTAVSKSANLISDFSNRLGLSDPWRASHPSDRVFSFFSGVHHTFSRIDFFLVDNRLLSKVSSTVYHPIVISDHAPTSVDLSLPTNYPDPRHWKFSSYMLADEEFRKYLSFQIEFYFSLNNSPEINIHPLWEAFKAYMRGQIVSYVSYTRKIESCPR